MWSRAREASPWESILYKFRLWSRRSVRRCLATRETPPGFWNFLGARLAISAVLGITKMSPNFSHVLEIRKSDPSSKLKSVGTHLNAIFYCEGKHCLSSTNELVGCTRKISWFRSCGSQITYHVRSLGLEDGERSLSVHVKPVASYTRFGLLNHNVC